MKTSKFALVLTFLLIINVDSIADIRSKDNVADYILIYPPTFANLANDYSEWIRETQKLNVLSISIDQVYSDFDTVLGKSNSISNFLNYAMTEWLDPKPRYVLLFGGIEYIPSYKVFVGMTNYEDSTSVDMIYSVKFNQNDIIPDLIIGRFPASNIDEMQILINKTMLWKNTVQHSKYLYDMSLLAGFKDSSLFRSMVSYYPNNYKKYNAALVFAEFETDYRGTIYEYKDRLVSGSKLVFNYNHANPFIWDSPTYCDTNIINELDWGNLPGIFLSIAKTHDLDSINNKSIYKELLFRQNGGAVASLAFSGVTFLQSSHNLLLTFTHKLINDKPETIGEAFFAMLTSDEIPIDLRYKLSLFGEPTLYNPFLTNSAIESPISTNVNISPNPCDRFVVINHNCTENSVIELFNSHGQQLFKTINSNLKDLQINTGEFPSGLYYLKIRTGTKTFIEKLVVYH